MDDFDRLALAAAREVMQSEPDTAENNYLRAAAQLVLRMALERGWLSETGADWEPIKIAG